MQKYTNKNKRVSRFFIDESLTAGSTISLPGSLVNYLVNVLRLKSGDDIILFNGRAKTSVQDSEAVYGEFTATLSAVSKRSASVTIQQFVNKDLESPVKIHLFQGISRNERMDITIQKAVELGVDGITPVFTQRCNAVKWNDKQLEKKRRHWQSIAHSACEQSGRTKLVRINPAVQVRQLDEYTAQLNLLLAPDSDSSLSDLKHLKPKTINIFIGPEGGLTEAEIHLASNNHFQPIRLGPRILRTETAGLTTISVIQFIWGDLA